VISGPKSDRQTTIDIHGRTRRRETVRDKNADGKYPDDGKRKQKHAEANAVRRERVSAGEEERTRRSARQKCGPAAGRIRRSESPDDGGARSVPR